MIKKESFIAGGLTKFEGFPLCSLLTVFGDRGILCESGRLLDRFTKRERIATPHLSGVLLFTVGALSHLPKMATPKVVKIYSSHF